MATSKEYIEYVCEQIKDFNPSYKKMFGEYMVYVNLKPLLLVCDDTVYVKMLDCVKSFFQNDETGFPYDGAKLHYIVDVDNKDLLCSLIPILEKVIPVPKKRK